MCHSVSDMLENSQWVLPLLLWIVLIHCSSYTVNNLDKQHQPGLSTEDYPYQAQLSGAETHVDSFVLSTI